MAEYRFRLSLTAERYLSYYRGSARAVLVQAEDGTRVQFPARHLQPFVTRDGIFGRFLLRTDDQQRVTALRRLGD